MRNRIILILSLCSFLCSITSCIEPPVEVRLTEYEPVLIDANEVTKSVEAIELSTPEQPTLNIPIRDISFHTTLLVPSRIEVSGEFAVPSPKLARLNTAMGY